LLLLAGAVAADAVADARRITYLAAAAGFYMQRCSSVYTAPNCVAPTAI